jgi:hypothetical protein
MKPIVRNILIFLLGWFIVVVGIWIFSILGLANPFFSLTEIFVKVGVEVTYDFNTFGFLFNLWAISATLPVLSLNLFSQPLAIDGLIPFLTLSIICIFAGFKLGMRKGIPTSILIVFGGTILGIVLAVSVPFTLPTAGVSPEDQTIIRGLGDELIKLTYLIPLNFLVEVIITLGFAIGSVFIGVIGRKILTPEKTT